MSIVFNNHYGYHELVDDYMMIAGFVKHLYISCFLRRPIGNSETNFRRYHENMIFYLKFGGFQDAELV
jgi:hypothetical protein